MGYAPIIHAAVFTVHIFTAVVYATNIAMAETCLEKCLFRFATWKADRETVTEGNALPLKSRGLKEGKSHQETREPPILKIPRMTGKMLGRQDE